MLERLNRITDEIIGSYQTKGGINHLSGPNLPSRQSVANILTLLESLIFPGYQEGDLLDWDNVHYTTGEKCHRAAYQLISELSKSLEYDCKKGNENKECSPIGCRKCRDRAEETACALLKALPDLRKLAMTDVGAALMGDPAARSRDEIILSYPGVEAITIHRIAHFLYKKNIPLVPRMINESVHRRTGIDIHPGAVIGECFFIDHGTGVVIGETTEIGKNVKVYQGVTLGALSVNKFEANKKRHPTIEDNVTIYAGATILGGKTVIGKNTIIGGNTWIVRSVEPESRIYYNTNN